MPHLRKRYARPICQNLLKFSPIVGVFGHRQVGKTTLLEVLSGSYTSLDDLTAREQASQNPRAYLADALKVTKSGKPAAIDESLWCPELFPTLKEHVRTHKNPGQFRISGSVRL